jgi:hypothetical protein
MCQDGALKLRKPLADVCLDTSVLDPGGDRMCLSGLSLCGACWDSSMGKLVACDRSFENPFPDVFVRCVVGSALASSGRDLYACPVFSCDVTALKAARSASLVLFLPTDIPVDVCVISCIKLVVASWHASFL